MASEEQLAKAESIRDHAAKGNLPDIKKMVQENLEDVIWWINEGNTRGNTALQLAAMWGHVDCCQELLAAGADKDKQSNVREHAPGASACVSAHGCPAAANEPECPQPRSSSRRLLLSRFPRSPPGLPSGARTDRAHAADVRRDQGRACRRSARAYQARRKRQQAGQRKPAVHHLRPAVGPGSSLTLSLSLSAAQDGWTALHHAASDGDVVVVRALLEGGASRKIKNEVRPLAPPR